MPSRLEFQELAKTKIKEAKVLFRNRLYHGAFYVAGYALEFSLKAAVCRNLDLDNFYDLGMSQNSPKILEKSITDKFKTHDYNHLIVLAGLHRRFHDYKSLNLAFGVKFSHIENLKWSEKCRYEQFTHGEEDVKEFIKAIEEFVKWIKRYW